MHNNIVGCHLDPSFSNCNYFSFSIVGVTKQSPRYPPPPPHPSQRTAHPSKVHPDHMQSQSPQAQQGQYKADPEKIRRYSEDVKQKKEREAEEEFLRSSLRGSKKLQQLEKQRKLRYQEDQEPKANGHRHDHFQPAINKAFEPDDQQDTTNESSLSSPVHQPRCRMFFIPTLKIGLSCMHK